LLVAEEEEVLAHLGFIGRNPVSVSHGLLSLWALHLDPRGPEHGDSETARRMAKHLHTIHTKVAGDIIDVGAPELGGYAASEPRDAMWAALTEMHSMLWLYERFAFRDGRPPRRLSPEKRDRYLAEVAEYCRLVGAEEAKIPHTFAELDALYEEYADLFGPSETLAIMPATGENFEELAGENMKKNFHRSQLPSFFYAIALDHGLFRQLAIGASSGGLRRSLGMGPVRSRVAVAGARLGLPLVWVLQQKPFERFYMRLMWGPDGVRLIESARELRAQVRR